MTKERIIEQKAFCMSDNHCVDCQPTPSLLTDPDTLNRNKVNDCCEGCRFLGWRNVKIPDSK